jgi:hypothetical protein
MLTTPHRKKKRLLSWLAEKMLAYQEGLCSMECGIILNYIYCCSYCYKRFITWFITRCQYSLKSKACRCKLRDSFFQFTWWYQEVTKMSGLSVAVRSELTTISFVVTTLDCPYRFTLATSWMDTRLGRAGQVERGLLWVAVFAFGKETLLSAVIRKVTDRL